MDGAAVDICDHRHAMPPYDLRSPTPSRRAVLKAAALGLGTAMLAPACLSSSAGTPDDPLLTLGRTLDEGPDRDALRPIADTIGPLADAAAVEAALARLDLETRRDFAEGRTVLGRGWLLARTEAATLVAYARAAG
jgi:hypothetical protein